MNANWVKIFEMIQKPERLIIGLMSGTSLDGLDIALCAVRGSGIETQLRLIEFKTIEYTPGFKTEVKSIFSRRDADLQAVCLMNEKIALTHADLILKAINSWGLTPGDIDVIASHGQTIFHAPKSLHGLEEYPNATLQIGDGDHIAVKTGIVTISDFRQKHIAAGGEGAPLALYGDYLLFSEKDQDRLMLNIGGISNFTYLPGLDDRSKLCATDVGPGNTLMDQYVQAHFEGKFFDADAAIARSGVSNPSLLAALLDHDFFNLGFPKTTGPELFSLSYLNAAIAKSNNEDLNKEDILATLCDFSAQGIIKAIQEHLGDGHNARVFVSGGGMHNPLLMQHLKQGLPNFSFETTDAVGINPDAKEAVLFALLANETLVGTAMDFGTNAMMPSVTMGKISLPC